MALDTDERAFLARTWRADPHGYAEVVSRGEWKPYRYLRHIGRIIADAVYRGDGRIIINLPPRHGKSLFASKWVPTWFLDTFPTKRVLPCSYAAELATEWGRQVRNEASGNELVGFKLRDDSASARRWHTQAGGGMLCSGVGGSVTGFGGDLIPIDDPHKNWEEGWSALKRRRVVEWFQGTLYSRLEPGGTIVVLKTRWHPADLSGWLVEHHTDEWQVVRLPAIAEENDEMGRRPGDPLCPERYDVDSLERIREAVGPAVWQATYQQNPGAASAGLAYDHFGAANIDPTVALRPELPVCLAFDFNINPGMHVEVGQYDSKADQFTVRHEVHGHRMSLEAAMAEVGKILSGYGWRVKPELHVYGDPSGGGASIHDGRTSYEIIRQRAALWWPLVRVRARAGAIGVRDSMDTLNDALSDQHGAKHVRIHPDCERLLADMREVMKDEDGLIDKSDPLLTHASDCLRYWVYELRPLGGRVVRQHGRLSVV